MPAAMQANGLAPLDPGQPHGGGRGVLLVIGVEYQDAVERPGDHRADLVILSRRREHHVDEVLGVIQIVARVDERLAERILECPRGDGRHLGDHPVGRDHALVGIGNIGAVVIEGRQRADHAAHDGHRMRVAPEPVDELVQLLVHHRVMGDGVHEFVLLPGGRQFAVEQEVADLHEVAVRGQLFDRVTAMQQDAGLAVDESDLGFATPGGRETRVVGEHIRRAVELTDVDHPGAAAALQDGERDLVAGGVVDDRDAVLRRGVATNRVVAHLRSPLLTRNAGGAPGPDFKDFAPSDQIHGSRASRSPTPMASSIRPSVSSRPRTAATSNIPGETVVPARHTRKGCATAPNLVSRPCAKPRIARSISSLFPRLERSERVQQSGERRTGRPLRAVSPPSRRWRWAAPRHRKRHSPPGRPGCLRAA